MIRHSGPVRAPRLPGATVWKWELPVPYLPQGTENGAIFLYKSKDAAERHVGGGGSGFLVGVESEANPSALHLYAVSNEHVSTGYPVIRLTNVAGETEIIDGVDTDWVEHPAGDDIAVRPLGVERKPTGPVATSGHFYFGAERLLTRDDLRFGVGPVLGNDCFMIGRYISHNDEQLDRGVIRFGNLSMLPEHIRQKERSFDQESLLVDMRSVPGFSGSVVVIYFTEPGTISALEMTGGGHPPGTPLRELISKHWVLGIDWGHLLVSQKIWEDGVSKRVKAESSMAAVVPAWKLTELLTEVGDVVKPRETVEAELARGNESAAELDVHGETELGLFEDLAKRIVNVPKAEVDALRERDEKRES
jgi:hypothetical protein